LALILVAVLVGKAVGERGTFTKGGLISGHAALAFGSATAIMLITRQPLVAGLAFLSSALVAHSRVETGVHHWREVVLGALCGTGLSMAVFYLFQVVASG
ncbi:MAG: phosphatase PAP2 family protein, partial [Candidatus Eremiobacterota bacterium]